MADRIEVKLDRVAENDRPPCACEQRLLEQDDVRFVLLVSLMILHLRNGSDHDDRRLPKCFDSWA